MKKNRIVRVHLVKNDGTISVVIPKQIREELGIEAGDHLFVYSNKQNHVIFKKVTQSL